MSMKEDITTIRAYLHKWGSEQQRLGRTDALLPKAALAMTDEEVTAYAVGAVADKIRGVTAPREYQPK